LLERIKSLAQFAQHDVRYVKSASARAAGVRTMLLTSSRNRYGDCKGQSTVLSSMLAQIGVKSYYVLVNTERGIVNEKAHPWLTSIT